MAGFIKHCQLSTALPSTAGLTRAIVLAGMVVFRAILLSIEEIYLLPLQALTMTELTVIFLKSGKERPFPFYIALL